MSEVRHEPAPSPWRGACTHCGGQLMRVHRRPIAGGMPLWAAVSIALMVTGATILSVMETHGWPFGVVAFLAGLWLGVHRFERWQCRRCRTMYRELVGEGSNNTGKNTMGSSRISNDKLSDDKSLRAHS